MHIIITIDTELLSEFPQAITTVEDRERRAEAVYSAAMQAARDLRMAYEMADDKGPDATPLEAPHHLHDLNGKECGVIIMRDERS